MIRQLAVCAALGSLAGCVPEGPPTGDQPGADPDTGGDPLISQVFRDDFEREQLGDDWNLLSDAWHIAAGELCVAGAQNQGAWLKRRLPRNARIRFDARSDSPDGDIKAEVWGDGESGASEASYTATSYVLIFGGWKNARHALARLDEHGRDRQVIEVGEKDDPRAARVEAGRNYKFVIERRDGRTVRWWVNGTLMFSYADPKPLSGQGHDHFGFNDWTTPVCFDNLQITPLT